MAIPTNREELIKHCKRSLGWPVIEINVDDDQVDDLVDDTLQIYHDYHMFGTERTFLKYTLTSEDVENQYITLPDHFVSVLRLFSFESGSTHGEFSPLRETILSDYRELHGLDILSYHMNMQYYNFVNQQLNPENTIQFNRNTDKVYIEGSWDYLKEGKKLLFEVYRATDPTMYPGVYNDEFVKKYLTALIKKQWGSNLKKYSGVQLPGGIEMNGSEIYQEAVEEIEKLEELLITEARFQAPAQFFMG